MNVPLPSEFGLLRNKVTQYDDESKLTHLSVVMNINTKSVFVKYRQVVTIVEKKGFNIQLKTWTIQSNTKALWLSYAFDDILSISRLRVNSLKLKSPVVIKQ